MNEVPQSISGQPESDAHRHAFARRLRKWIVAHDDSWLFIGGYVGLAVVLSIAISLFWLVVVVAIHGIFEWIRQVHHAHRDLPSRFARVGWELKLDIGLVLFALVLAVYMDVILGAAGLGSAARLGVQAGARFTGWQNLLRGFLLSVDDAAHIVRAIGKSSRQRAESEAGNTQPDTVFASVPGVDPDGDPADDPDAEPAELRRWGGWTQERWGVGDWLALWLLAGSGLLLLAGPWLSPHDLPEIRELLAEELHPWPTGEPAP